MYDTQLSNVLNARYNLLEECAGCHFINLLVLHDVVEEFAAGGELHDKVQFLRCLDDLVKLNDVGVLDDLKDVDFARNTLNISNVNNFTLFEYFDGHLFVIQMFTVIRNCLSLMLSCIYLLTFSLVMMWRPSLTFPNVPSPIDLPRMYCPTLRSFAASLMLAALLLPIMRIAFESLIVLLTAAVGVLV